MTPALWLIGTALAVISVTLVRISRTLDDVKHQVYRNGSGQEGDGE